MLTTQKITIKPKHFFLFKIYILIIIIQLQIIFFLSLWTIKIIRLIISITKLFIYISSIKTHSRLRWPLYNSIKRETRSTNSPVCYDNVYHCQLATSSLALQIYFLTERLNVLLSWNSSAGYICEEAKSAGFSYQIDTCFIVYEWDSFWMWRDSICGLMIFC